MWRSLTVALFLLVLASSANALPIPESIQGTNHHEAQENTYEPISHVVQLSKTDASSASVDDEQPEDLFNLPRTLRASASVFNSEVQTSPNYVLEIEFFEIKLSAGQFKHLANPPLVVHWFEQLSHQSHSSRISGWKDGNSLYSSRITYAS